MSGLLLNVSPNDPRRRETYVGTQIGALRAAGWEVVAAYHTGASELAEPAVEGGIAYRAVAIGGTAAPKTLFQRSVKVARTLYCGNSDLAAEAELCTWKRLIRDAGADRILVQFGPVAARMLPALTACGRPWAVQFHGYDITLRCNHWGYRRTLATLLETASAAFVPSAFLERELRRYIRRADAKKIHRITPGYDQATFVPLARQPRAGRPFRLISVGRLVAVKGHQHVIDAVARAGGNVELLIAGEGEERPFLERRIREHGLGERVRLAGALPAGAVCEAFGAADAFIQLSTETPEGAREGLGLSAVEAAATGLPVVVSNSGGLGETCIDGKTGWVVADGDIGGAAAAISALHHDPVRARAMGEAGALWVAETYASRKQAALADSVLRRL